MTRTHRHNEVPHNHPEAEGAYAEHQIPKWFGKAGHIDQAPNKVKKNGSGRANWGKDGDELHDALPNISEFHARRRTNSKGHLEDMILSKFEEREHEPVFDESIHGAAPDADDGSELETVDTNGTVSTEGEVRKVNGSGNGV